ncbi:MAG: UbiD family decarboxylase [Chloroflexota bacterium]|nr:MAG: UbiD family decarboxylase [Chloroflexota bacterium]
MAFDDLQSYLRRLEQLGELKRIRTQCDPVLEIPEIAWRVVREEGPALLFERVAGSPYPLAINVLASARRIEIALGRHPQQIGEELLELAQRISQPTPGRLWSERGRLWSLLSMRTSKVRRARSQEIEESPNLGELPTLHCWPADGGRFITLPMVLTSDPTTGHRNLGTYRMQIFDATTTGMHWQIQKGGRFHYEAAEAAGRPLDVAVAIGADPALVLSSIAPLPENVDELAFAGMLRGKPTRLAQARSSNMLVPADAEFILEGTVEPGERRQEGPFGDHFGHYSLAAPFPVFHVKRVTHRQHPVYLASVVGKPPQEDKYLGDAVQEITAPLVRLIQPEIRSLWAYAAAGFHNLLVISVRVRYPREGIKSALSLLGQGQTALSKCVVLVDDDVNPRDFFAMLRAMRDGFDPRHDLTVIERAPLDTLDFTSFQPHVGGKMILDATRKADRPAPTGSTTAAVPSALVESLRKRGADVTRARLVEGALLVASVEGQGRAALPSVMAEASLLGAPLAAVVSPDVPLDDPEALVWGIFTRFDAGLDLVRELTAAAGVEAQTRPVLGIDATWKPGYPEPVKMRDDVVALVSRRWKEYWQG